MSVLTARCRVGSETIDSIIAKRGKANAAATIVVFTAILTFAWPLFIRLR